MTRESQLNLLRVLSGETDCDVLNAYLDLAEAKVLHRCYPYNPEITDVPARYHQNVVDIGAYLLDKRGATGETTHDENGIKRVFESADVPLSMLREIIPRAKVI